MDNKDTITIETDIKYHYDNEPNGVQINPFLISLKKYLNDNSSLFSKRIQWKFEIFIYFIHEFYLIESSNEYYIKIDYNKIFISETQKFNLVLVYSKSMLVHKFLVNQSINLN